MQFCGKVSLCASPYFRCSFEVPFFFVFPRAQLLFSLASYIPNVNVLVLESLMFCLVILTS